MLYFNLVAIMKTRQIERPYSYLVQQGSSPHTAHKLLHAQTRTVRLDHIERLCEILHCEPNDLIQFRPNSVQKQQANHPLKNLIQKEVDFDWQNTLKTMPLEKLKELSKLITDAENKEAEVIETKNPTN